MTLGLYLCASQVLALCGLFVVFGRRALWLAYTGRDPERPTPPGWWTPACAALGLGLLALAAGCVALAAEALRAG